MLRVGAARVARADVEGDDAAALEEVVRAERRRCAVLLFDEPNPKDAVVVAVWV